MFGLVEKRHLLGIVFFLILLQPIYLQNQNLVLGSVIHTIPPYTDYWNYDKERLPLSIITTTRDSSATIMFYSFIRDQNQALKLTEVKDVNLDIIYYFKYYYNTANELFKIEKFSDMDYDGKVDDLDHEFNISYDSLGRVVALKINKGFTVARDFRFTWDKDNIIRVDNEDGELNYHMDLSFDSVPNKLEAIKWEYLTTTGNVEFYVALFCKNNIIKATLYPASLEKDELELDVEYDENGLFQTNHFERVIFSYK